MQKLLQFFTLLCVCSVFSKNGTEIKVWELEDRSLEEAIVHILQKCFPTAKNIANMVHLKNESSNYIFEYLRNSELVTTSIDLDEYPKKVRLRGEVDIVITTAKTKKDDNLPELEGYEKFHLFTKSLLFLINNNDSSSSHDCNWSLANFNETQNRQYLKTYFFCIDNKKVKVYTHTPDIQWAPLVWETPEFRKTIAQKKNETTLHLFERNYLKENICQDFIYDVSHNLSGYPLKIASLGRKYDRPYLDEKLSMILQKVFNLSPIVQRLSHSELRQLMRKKKFDIFLESQHISSHNRNDEIYTVAFPITYYSIVIVTNNRGLMSPLEKIFNYYGYLIVVSTVIILAITLIVIYVHTLNLTFAFFEILRLLINSEIYTSMKTTSIRIFFTTIFLYFLVIHGTFSGRLAEFLTRNEYRKNVETLEDLEDPQYTKIYTYQHAAHFMRNSPLKNKTDFRNLNCIDQIKNNPSVACINDLIKLLPTINELELHQPRKVLLTGYFVQLIRKNSPLTSKINNLMISLMHSGLAQKWTNDKIANEMRGIRIKEAKALIHYRPIDFDDLFFSFVLLGIGLFCSAICFIIEIFLKKFVVKEKQKRARGRWIFSKALIKSKQKNTIENIEIKENESFHDQRGRNITSRIIKRFTRYLLRHW